MQMRKSLLAIAVLGLALVFAAPAMAQDPTQDAYGGVLGGQEVDEDNGGGGVAPDEASGGGGGSSPEAATVSPPPTQQVSEGSLPFTGFEVGVVLLMGAGLVGLGLVLRRAGRSPTS
jgi:hypothetical protein